MMYGPQAAFVSEMFSTDVRYSGASLGYQLGAILGGAFAPIIATALLAESQHGRDFDLHGHRMRDHDSVDMAAARNRGQATWRSRRAHCSPRSAFVFRISALSHWTSLKLHMPLSRATSAGPNASAQGRAVLRRLMENDIREVQRVKRTALLTWFSARCRSAGRRLPLADRSNRRRRDIVEFCCGLIAKPAYMLLPDCPHDPRNLPCASGSVRWGEAYLPHQGPEIVAGIHACNRRVSHGVAWRRVR